MQNAVELVTPLTLEECRRLLRCQLDRPFPFSRGKRCFKCLDFCTRHASPDIRVIRSRQLPGGSATCLDPYIPSFEGSLVEKNYTPGTIKTYRVLVRRLASFMEVGGNEPQHLTVDLAAQLVRGEERHRHEPNKCRNIARRFAEHLIDLGVAPAPVVTARQIARANLRAGYEDYLHRQRGLSQRSIFHAWRFADRFLDHRFGDGDIDLAATAAAVVCENSLLRQIGLSIDSYLILRKHKHSHAPVGVPLFLLGKIAPVPVWSKN